LRVRLAASPGIQPEVIHSNRVGASVILKNPRPFTVDIFYRIPVELKRRVLFVKQRKFCMVRAGKQFFDERRIMSF
jgi:hypothetical protein